MKRLTAIFVVLALLSGCNNENSKIDKVMSLRESVLSSDSCSFSVQIIADYPEESYDFSMDCTSDDEGNIDFCVTAPNTITGITGTLSQEGGKLTFDDKYLVFAPLADGLITPVSAPWIFLNTLRSGYISGCSEDENGLMVVFNDCYQEGPLDLILTLDNNEMPISAEIVWQGRRIVTIIVINFTIV